MKFELPGILQFLLAGAFVFLLPGCGGGNEDQEADEEMEAATSGEENPEVDASLRDFLPGKAVVGAFVEGELFDKASMRFLFAEGGGFTLSQIGRDRKVSGTYEVKGPVVVVRIEDKEAIAMLEFPGGIPKVGGEIQLEADGEIGRGRITAIQANATYGQVPRAPADFMKLPGTPLNEREKQYVGRWAGGDQDNQWTTIIREDHTYSYLNTGKEYDEDGEEVPGKEARTLAHGIWTIANESIYFMDLVFMDLVPSDPQSSSDPDDEPYPSFIMEIVSMEAGKVVCINATDGVVAEDGGPYKSVERRIEKFEEPEMKPFNGPEALKGFDVLKAYEEAKDPEVEEGAPAGE